MIVVVLWIMVVFIMGRVQVLVGGASGTDSQCCYDQH